LVTNWNNLGNSSNSIKIFADKILLVKEHLAIM